MKKSLVTFTDMFRLSAIVAPLNVTTKKLAGFLAHRFESCKVTDVVDDDFQSDVLILYETKRTDFSMIHHSVIMSMEHPPSKIIIVVGFGTKISKFQELSIYPIALIYGLFCENKTSMTIQLYPISHMADNLILTGSGKCDSNSGSFVDNGLYHDISVGTLHFSSGLTIKALKSALVTGGDKKVFGYFNEYNESHFEKTKEVFEETMQLYRKMRDTCNSYIILEGDELVVTK